MPDFDGTGDMTPYYQDRYVTIYHGDCREILPNLELEDAIITDPIWPNTTVYFPGTDKPYRLLHEMCLSISAVEVKRLVIHLGCDTDPRFLRAIPATWPFLRLCQLEYVIPHYKGRILYNADYAYIFGRPPAYIKGRQLMTGGCRSRTSDRENQRHTGRNHARRKMEHSPEDNLVHPTPRRLEHLRWLVTQFSDTQVCDPFMGSGTTLVAAHELNRKCIGIDISEKYCEVTVNKLRQSVFDLR